MMINFIITLSSLASASVGAFPFQRLADGINYRLTYNVGQPIITMNIKIILRLTSVGLFLFCATGAI